MNFFLSRLITSAIIALLCRFLSLTLSAEIPQPQISAPHSISIFNSALPHWNNSLGLTLVKTDPPFGWGSTRMITRQQFALFLDDPHLSFPKIDYWHLQNRSWKKKRISRAEWKSEGSPEEPAIGVSWLEAVEFCHWLTEKESQLGLIQKNQAYRLPTDLEWSHWVGLDLERGSTPAERNRKIDYYPWGKNGTPPEGYGNFAGLEAKTDQWPKAWKTLPIKSDPFPKLAPVASFPANRLGFYDLPGNVMEWCQDLFQSDSTLRVIRGIPWYNASPEYFIVSRRLRGAPTYREEGLGFRVVLDKNDL